MSNEKILIIEDEDAIAELLQYNLSHENYQVRRAATGEAGLKMVTEFRPSLILLDLMLPGIDGLGVCRALKQKAEFNHIPIVMLTAKSDETDIVIGLELGADDYVTKPFSSKVLLSRIRSVLRRIALKITEDNSSSNLSCGPILMNNGTRVAEIDGKALQLTCSEFDILYMFIKRPGWVFTRSQIVNAVRGDDYPVTERAMDVQIVGLRKKLGNYAGMIETIRAVGYRFNPEIEE